MVLPDVNVLVHAHRSDSSSHREYRSWLDRARNGNEPLGLTDQVLSGFVRVVTHPRVFKDPTPTPRALAFVETLYASPTAVRVRPGDRVWSIFAELVTETASRGNLIPDAYLAATAIEAGATLFTADRGFARFGRLRWRHPLT
ncbi:MAG: type II toxin-antitoxin system VapC family toxin [Actinomycetota bacterium]